MSHLNNPSFEKITLSSITKSQIEKIYTHEVLKDSSNEEKNNLNSK